MVAGAVAWACVPMAHVVKHVPGLPDRLRPNTYTSILFLAAFSMVVAAAGTGCGVLVHRLSTAPATRDSRSA